jgi:serine/threonine-protein kinase
VAVSDTLTGTLFDGRYQVVRKLGAGGMADVYLAEDQELGRRVAIKILNGRHANDEQFVERFRREAKNAAALSHPNIVSIYDRGEAEGTYYIAIEYTRQILSALRFAHRHGIVHRDIKPHNVLVDAEGRVKVTDFGIARAGTSQMTEAGSIVGTAQYLSPEQARGDAVDQRSDLYSLGVVLYELLTGTLPFTGDRPVEIAMKHLSQVPEPPSARRPGLPPELDLVVMRALAKDPGDRYQTAEEMDADLERVARGAAVSRATEESATQIIRGPTLPLAAGAAAATATVVAPPRRGAAIPPPPPVYYDLDEPARRRPVWPWIAALLFVVGAGIGGWFLYQQISHKLASNAPVPVENYVGLRVALAQAKIKQDGLTSQVTKQASRTTPQGFVFKQQPQAGVRIPKGNPVTIWVSTGVPKVAVPDLRGKQSTDAVATLKDLHLKPDVHEVPSNANAGTVTAQDPPAGTSVPEGTSVRINVSKGPTPVAVPGVVGQPLDTASSILQAAGFHVSTTFVDSNQPANTVIDQSPDANTSAAKGSVVTLTVSKGPSTSTVPDVTSLDLGTAESTLQDSGFHARVVYQDVTDPNNEGLVLSQTPQGGTQAKPGSTVTLTVGRYTAATTTAATTTTTGPPTP